MLNRDDAKISTLVGLLTTNRKLTSLADTYAAGMDMTNYQWQVEAGSKYLRVDEGSSGFYMINRETEQVYFIKGYGVPNLKKPHGTVDQMIHNLNIANENGTDYVRTYWYAVPSIPLA